MALPGAGRMERREGSVSETTGGTVLVCGGRRYSDIPTAFRVLDEIKPDVVVQGEATGADAIAKLWAKQHRVVCFGIRANWDRDGVRAGPIRNQKMLDKHRPRLVVAFPGGKGTADMVSRARAAGVEVREIGGPT